MDGVAAAAELERRANQATSQVRRVGNLTCGKAIPAMTRSTTGSPLLVPDPFGRIQLAAIPFFAGFAFSSLMRSCRCRSGPVQPSSGGLPDHVRVPALCAAQVGARKERTKDSTDDREQPP